MSLLLKVTMFFVFCLINLGGYVHNTGSSLACPDWPLCFGQVMPEMVGGVLIEHSHRLLGSLVGFLTILNLIFAYKKFPNDKKIKRWSWIALGMVIFQGVLGGITVIYRLPSMVSTAHLGTSMLFFITLIYIHHLVTKKQKTVKIFSKEMSFFKPLLLGVVGLVYIQMILGALIRHLGLGASCGLGYENSLICFDVLNEVKTWFPVSAQASIHMFHRLMGIITGFSVIGAFVYLFRNIKKELGVYKLLFLAPVFFVVVQIKLGILTIGTDLGPVVTMLHLGGAALLFTSTFKLYLIFLDQIEGREGSHSKFKDFVDLTKPRLSSLVIFTMALGIFSAPVSISWFNTLFSILGTTLLVAGSCALNCYIEIDIDSQMKRTAVRPLPSKRLAPNEALYFGIALIAISLPIIYLSSNLLTLLLGIIASVVYLAIYTPMKTRSGFAVFWGAIPGAIPPLMGWTTAMNEISSMGVVLFTLLFVWQLPHFFAIALYHGEDYAKAGIKVIPNEIGEKATVGRILLFTFSLLGLGIFPFFIGHSDSIAFFIINMLIGLTFLKVAFEGIKITNDSKLKEWARRYFLGSVVYLPAVMLVLIFFK